MSLVSFFRLYTNTFLTYGFARAITYDYEGQKKYYNDITREFELKDMLLVDKVASISGKTCVALLVWPGMLYLDLIRLECAVRRKDPTEYK